MPTRDASSPARFVSTASTTTAESGTSASFSPPDDSWLFASVPTNEQIGLTSTVTVTNTGTALTWTQVAKLDNPSGGGAAVYRAYNATAQVGITVTTSITYSGASVTASSASTNAWVDVWTGCATSQTGAAAATSSGTATTTNPSVTTTASGSRVAGLMLDWGANGNPTSSDTIDSYTVATFTSGGRAYKASDSGAAGSVSLNFVTTGSPVNTFIVYEILAATTSQTKKLLLLGIG